MQNTSADYSFMDIYVITHILWIPIHECTINDWNQQIQLGHELKAAQLLYY